MSDDLAGQIRREYPLLCAKGVACRPEDKGGPRRTNYSWICEQCADYLRADLVFIAESWGDLEDALVSSEIAGGDKGKQKHGMVSVGTNLNEKVMAARQNAIDVVWFILGVLRDDYDEINRAFNPPSGSIPEMAQWIAKWHIDHLARGTADETSVEIATDVSSAKRKVSSAAYPSGARWIEVGLPCDQHGTSDLGERTPCDGILRALVGIGRMPDLVCTVDGSHTVEPIVWEREGWRRAHRQFNPAGAMALAKKIAT